jgi:hypothetical protein
VPELKDHIHKSLKENSNKKQIKTTMQDIKEEINRDIEIPKIANLK